jgi:FixJ family two-component response regulator
MIEATPLEVVVWTIGPHSGTVAHLAEMLGYQHRSVATIQECLAQIDLNNANCAVYALSPNTDIAAMRTCMRERHIDLPMVFVSQTRSVRKIVEAMRGGAIDLLFPSAERKDFTDAITRAAKQAVKVKLRGMQRLAAREKLSRLSPREAEVVRHVLSGQLNKQIAHALGTVEKTVKVHRARAMRKLGVRSVPDLFRLSLSGGLTEAMTSEIPEQPKGHTFEAEMAA